MPAAKRRRGAVARKVGDDQGPVLAQLAEATAKLFSRTQEAMAEHQGLPLAADQVTESLAADLDEPFVHHQRAKARFGRDPSGQVCVKTGRHASMASLKPHLGFLRRSFADRPPLSLAVG